MKRQTKLELVIRVNWRACQLVGTFGVHHGIQENQVPPVVVLEFLDVMRNKRQGLLGSEESDNPTIQQLMKTVSAL